jgi:hypothetical protein
VTEGARRAEFGVDLQGRPLPEDDDECGAVVALRIHARRDVHTLGAPPSQHAVERLTVDTEPLRRARAATVAHLQRVEHVVSEDLLERWEVRQLAT